MLCCGGCDVPAQSVFGNVEDTCTLAVERFEEPREKRQTECHFGFKIKRSNEEHLVEF